jgi:uncharacterized RDD family membrane protein YckC
MTKAEIKKELRMIFDEIDTDGSGSIDAIELEENAGLLGFGNLTAFEISGLFNEADTNGDGLMDFDEFQEIVSTCRDSSSLWANAGALENAVKRYNNVLVAADSLFSPVQELAAASAETDDQGRKVAGCCRVCSGICVMMLMFLSTIGLMIAVGSGPMKQVWELSQEIDPYNAFDLETLVDGVAGIFTNVPRARDDDEDGIPNHIECPSMAFMNDVMGMTHSSTSQCRDTDGDGIPDYKDTDSDNDGIPDKIEASMLKIEFKRYPIGNNKLLSGTFLLPLTVKPRDTDRNGVPDYLDDKAVHFAKDDSAVTESNEGFQPLDRNEDGKADVLQIDHQKDTDGDGIPDIVECPSADFMNDVMGMSKCPDSDGDGTPDYMDTDVTDEEKRNAGKANSQILKSCFGAIYALIKEQMLAFSIYYGVLALFLVVGWTRSQAHLGHVLFGYHVVDMETGEPISFIMMLLRVVVFLGVLPITLVVNFAPQMLMETVTTCFCISFILNPLLMMFHPDSRNLYDLILGQQVVVR